MQTEDVRDRHKNSNNKYDDERQTAPQPHRFMVCGRATNANHQSIRG